MIETEWQAMWLRRERLTEEDWLICMHSKPLWSFLYGKFSDRKYRLFACHCCRRVWDRLEAADRREVEVWERYVEGLASEDELHAAAAGWCDPADFAWSAAEGEEARAQANLLREVMGNPFRPLRLDPSCLTSAVKALAQTIYDERRFDYLPILADALEETGCANSDLLAHCRQRAGHVRGCWALDFLLGKS
jgi:hypothetical protein